MATKKKDKDKDKDKEEKVIKPFEITSAQIADDFCNYSFEILAGVGLGDTHNVKGKGIIDPDLQEAFSKFNAHLAFVDDVFGHSGIEVADIDMFHTHDLTLLFNVTGFQIKGGEGNESIVLIGTKYVNSVTSRIELKSPKIPLDGLSSYKWHNELKGAADIAREEVALYKGGKCTAVETSDKEDSNQLTIEVVTE